MKTVFLIILLISEPLLAAECRDTQRRSVEIGGDAISGYVAKSARKPLRGALVRLYAGNDLVATDHTNHEGRFTLRHLSPGKYRLSVTDWGETTVEVNPKRDRPFLPQQPAWGITLSDSGCVDWGMSLD